MNVTSGLDFEGGHREEHGLAADGSVVDVPLHRHQVSLDFWRVEVEGEYTFADDWDVWLRLPYEIKERTAGIAMLQPATRAERRAMERNLESHHDTATLTGLSDVKALVARRLRGLASEDDVLDVAFGATLPTGRTEDDPFAAADEGRPHEHIQFGNGTVDPLLEAYYGTPLSPRTWLHAFTVGRFPLYENHRTYQGSLEITAGVAGRFLLRPRLWLHADAIGYYQGYAKWNGERDPNSGLVSATLGIGASVRVGSEYIVGLELRDAVSQRTLDDEGDVFEQGPTIRLGLTWIPSAE